MKTYIIATACLLSLSLSACQTFQGFKQDLGSLGKAARKTTQSVGDAVGHAGNTVGEKVTDIKTKATIKTQDVATAIVNNGTCPPISVDPQLSSMSEFYNMEKPTKGTEVSSIELKETKSSCSIQDEYLEVEIQLFFAGKLGPKAKRKSGDRPFFAYPYFVSVADHKNTELAKELFAASVTYSANQEKIELVETIRQKLPLNDDGTTPLYQIKLGFQLTQEQLFYNASR